MLTASLGRGLVGGLRMNRESALPAPPSDADSVAVVTGDIMLSTKKIHQKVNNVILIYNAVGTSNYLRETELSAVIVRNALNENYVSSPECPPRYINRKSCYLYFL